MTHFCLLLLLNAAVVHSLWHAYDAHKLLKPECPSNTSKTDVWKRRNGPVSKENAEKWKLWPNLLNSEDEENGGTLYGFEEGIEAIWKNQHPEDCSKAKYLISGGFESGFGSEFHVIGVGLAAAMNMGRVYVMFPTKGDSSLMDKMSSNNRFQVDIDFCKKQGNKLSLECYYEAWSHCTIEDALKGTSLQSIRNEGRHTYLQDIDKLFKSGGLVDGPYIAQLGDESEILPEVLRPVFECSPMHPEKYRYWWRSVATAYLMRPNEPTRQLIAQHRNDPEMKFDHNTEQCVSVYVRRGDKHLEMKLIADEKVFFNEAKELWKNVKGADKQSAPIMFVGSEDPNVVDSAIKWGSTNGWNIKYSNLFDRHSVSTHLNSSEQMRLREANKFVHHDMEYFTMVLNLDAHIRCSAFVCTHRSNFCRVIDELRATIGGKVNRQYADFTCQHAPCVDSSETGIDW